jgi:hypothetical protein
MIVKKTGQYGASRTGLANPTDNVSSLDKPDSGHQEGASGNAAVAGRGTDSRVLDEIPRRREPDVAVDTMAPVANRSPGPLSAVLRSPDVVLVIVAFLPAVALGASELGYLFGGGGWVLQRVLAVVDRRWIGKATDPIRQLAINLFEAFGRIWLLAGVIVLAAVIGERQDGLTAAVVILVAYSVAFVLRLSSGRNRARAVK